LFATPPSATPIDGGLSLVLGSCAIYGAKKIRKPNHLLIH
jgi:hypothetical protein